MDIAVWQDAIHSFVAARAYGCDALIERLYLPKHRFEPIC